MKHYAVHDRTYTDPIALVAGTLGGKWKLRVCWALRDRRQRYGDLRRALPGISPKMLTQQLRALEADGLVRREAFAEIPPRVEYRLTATGRRLLPALDALARWADSFHGTPERPPERSPKTTITRQGGPGQFYARPRQRVG